MGSNRLQMNPGKTKKALDFGPFSRIMQSSVLDGVAVPQTDLMCNLGVLLDSQLLLKSRCAYKGFSMLSCCAPVVFLHRRAQLIVTSALVTSQLDYYHVFYIGPLKGIEKLVKNAATRAVMCASRTAHVTLLHCEHHWLPACFWIQFRVLALTFDAFHSKGQVLYEGPLLPNYIFPSQSDPATCCRSHLLGSYTWQAQKDGASLQRAPTLWK